MKHSADINAKNKDDEAPLHVAAGYCDLESVKMLIRLKASPRSRSSDGDAPIHRAMLRLEILKQMSKDHLA